MTGRAAVFLLVVCRPILLLIGFVLRLVYRLFFSWWLNPALDHWNRKAFADEVRQAMPFLFDQYKARVVPDPRPEANDPHMDYVCIRARNLIFKFGRWRSENYEVRVSPSFAPTDSYEIVDALRVADPAANAQPFPEVASWKLLSRILEPSFHLLETAFHQDNFQDTKFRLAQLRLTPRL